MTKLAIELFIFLFAFISIFSQDVSQKSIGLEFIDIPSGEFSFDNSYYYQFHPSVKNTKNNNIIKVKVSSYSISKNPITRKQWEELMAKEMFTPWEKEKLPDCPTCPAQGVSYLEIQEFLNRLSLKETGKQNMYRLPTESELLYLFSSANSQIQWTGLGTSFRGESKLIYKNKFITMEEEGMKAYLWTGDYASQNYLEEFLQNDKLSLPIVDPIPKPTATFDYGRMLLQLSISKWEDRYVLNINRSGYTINSAPDSFIVNFRIVKNRKK